MSAAFFRAFNAIQPSVSRVVPYLSKSAEACRAIQLPADCAPYGKRHCMSPPMRGELLCAIMLLDARPKASRSFWAKVASHTVRKHSTWLHRPPATASMAAITDPAWPGSSSPLLIHEGRSRRMSSSAVMPPSDMPAPTVGPGYVDRPSMSLGSRPTSAIASSAASTARSSGSRPRRRPTCDIPMPVMATWSSNLSAFLGIGRKSWIFGSGAGNGPFSVSPVGSNSGIHTSSSCTNVTCTFKPTRTSAGSQLTMFVVRRTRSSSSIATMAIT